jgi:hypothetical protein
VRATAIVAAAVKDAVDAAGGRDRVAHDAKLASLLTRTGPAGDMGRLEAAVRRAEADLEQRRALDASEGSLAHWRARLEHAHSDYDQAAALHRAHHAAGAAELVDSALRGDEAARGRLELLAQTHAVEFEPGLADWQVACRLDRLILGVAA